MAIPPKPASFHPEAAPPGVEVKFVTFWQDRPKMPAAPRLQLAHTNAAQREGSITSAWNWAHAKPNSNTCPHYQIERDGDARKMLPSNRRGIANSTVNTREGAYGDVSWWSLAYETSDTGTLADPGISAFTDAQMERLAQIFAFEHIVAPTILLEYPTAWHAAGTASHTEPFGWPYWTLYEGKICPGEKKKRQVRDLIIPRAREIVGGWLGAPTPPPNPVPPGTRRAPMSPLRLGDEGMEVALLINYLKEFGWYPLQYVGDTNDGKYGGRAEEGVRNMQAAFKLTVDGFYGRQSEDALNAFLNPPPTPPVQPTDPGGIVDVIDFGWFQLHDGIRWPYSVAQTLYGDGELWPWIVGFNALRDDLSDWPGEGGYVKVPSLPAGVTGRGDIKFAGVRVRTPVGAAAAEVIGIAYPNESFAQRQARVPAWSFWNGGQPDTVPGEIVFCPA
jgi:peptidoglycan hydrolase-like protein with peptidoglycan-binding domain